MIQPEGFRKIIRISPDYTTITLDTINNDKSEEERLTPIIQQNEVLTDNFLDNCNQLINSVNNIDFVLPSKCKFVKQYASTNNSHQMMFVIEEEPILRTIRVNLPMEAPLERLRIEGKLEEYGYKDFELKPLGIPYLFSVAFPYVVHIIILNLYPDGQPVIEHFVFYRLSPLQSTYDYLLRPNLPNIDNSFRVCAGDYELTETSIPGIIQQYLLHFWSSHFNKDYLTHYLAYSQDEIITDFLQWQHHSKQNPKCVFNVGWQQAGILHNKIEKIEEYHHLSSEKYVDLHTLYELATNTKLKFNKNKPKVSFSNWIDSMWIEKYMISIGDKLKIKNKVFYVKDFLKDLQQQAFIVIEDTKGRLFRLKDTDKLRGLLLKEHENQHLEFTVTINGEIYNKGDTIILTVPGKPHQYATIDSFSRSKVGKLLIRLQNGYKYFVDSIKIQKFNKFNMIINNVCYEAGKKYLLFEKYPTTISIYRERIFKEASLDFGDIRLDFTAEGLTSYGRARIFGMSLYDLSRYQVVPAESQEISQVPVIFSFGRMYKGTSPFLSYQGVVYSKDNADVTHCNFEEIKQYITENEINFPQLKPLKVGDHIAISLWNEPLEMIKRRVITRIIVDNEKSQVRIETTDGETTREDPIVVFENIHYSSFKHIVTEYDGLTAGTVFKPQFSGIPCFPKKSNYRLIGFIECGVPGFPMMALMSNCCTLWPLQLKEDFQPVENINVDNPTIDKIKFQDLDMYNGGHGADQGVETSILLYNHNYAGLRKYDVTYMRISGGTGVTTNPRPSSRIGFIYPRKHQYGNYTTKSGLISGTYQVNFVDGRDNGRYRFIFDRRLFNNV